MVLYSSSQKHRLDRLFVFHTIISMIWGISSFLFPHLFGLFFEPGDKIWDWHPGGQGRVVHLLLRMFGALVMAQAWIVWNGRKVTNPTIRKSFVQAYFSCFFLIFLALLRYQLTGSSSEVSSWNWINICTFASLSLIYGWFVFKSPITIFEGLPKTMS